MRAVWPEVGEVDDKLIRCSAYLMDAAHEFRIRLKTYLAPKKGKVSKDIVLLVVINIL